MCVALDSAVYASEVELAAVRKHLLIDFPAASDPDGFVGFKMIEHLKVGEAVNALDFAWCATEHEGLSPR